MCVSVCACVYQLFSCEHPQLPQALPAINNAHAHESVPTAVITCVCVCVCQVRMLPHARVPDSSLPTNCKVEQHGQGRWL